MKGRFAPSPTGRMHLGNVMTALLSWLSARHQGGEWLLRIEDLDPQRSRRDFAMQIEDDLLWLGLTWDEGGLADMGSSGPYSQSRRGAIYESAVERLESAGATYPCWCSRADIMATQAPHESDGRVVYAGTCRPERLPVGFEPPVGRSPAVRVRVPDVDITFADGHYGPQTLNLAQHCGDFVVRRGDGAWAYQLAVVVDDAAMGVTEVVRGRDLLLSSPQQIFLAGLLGYDVPSYSHVPLLVNAAGQRLSKRDGSLDMGALRGRYTSQQLVGRLAWLAGLIDHPQPTSPADLVATFEWNKVPLADVVVPAGW